MASYYRSSTVEAGERLCGPRRGKNDGEVTHVGPTHQRLMKPCPVSPKLRQITEKAKIEPKVALMNLAHLLTPEMLMWSFQQLKKNAAAGMDGLTWRDYATDASERIASLHKSLCEQRYRAQPIRRAYVPKEDGTLRPLGVSALDDKICQRAVVEILNSIYEQDFYPFSYGFRPGRSAQDALDELNRLLFKGEVCWIIDADIRSYFDTVIHRELLEFVRKRVADRTILRLLVKWLRVGVIDDGRLLVSDLGAPQGSVISPLLANIYLHYVLDEWWVTEVVPRMRGRCAIVRYADDFVLGFERREDAERVMAVLGARFKRYGLELHSDKTRLLPFSRWEAIRRVGRGDRPETFNFLGFTHYHGRSRAGHVVYMVRTMAKRLGRSLNNIALWCREHRHHPLRWQWEMLCLKIKGHYNYYGRSTNFRCLNQFYHHACSLWYKWLSRRNGRKPLYWREFTLLLKRFPLPRPHITRKLSPSL